MHEDMRQLLNAYLDGELHGIRLLQMQTHLASCESCRRELRQLRRVSDLLQAAPPPGFRPVDRFVSNLALRLPRRSLRERPPRPGSTLWWLVPAGLLGSWFFTRTAFTISSLISAAGVTGFLGQAQSWLTGAGQQSLWFTLLGGLTGDQLLSMEGSAFGLVSMADSFGLGLLNGFFWQAVIVLLYWGWLAVWWLKRRPQPMKITASSVRS